jgi:hypothetical protein
MKKRKYPKRGQRTKTNKILYLNFRYDEKHL